MNIKNKKTIWIIDQYASTPESGKGGGARHYYVAKELVKLGYNVYVIAASFHHLLRKPTNQEERYKIENVEGFNLVTIKMPSYEHAHDKKRVLNWFLFTWHLRGIFKDIEDKPDTILASSPAPFMFLSAKYLAKKFKAKLVFEVRDIWPLTLKELGGYSSSHPFIVLMQWVEDKAYRDSDVVVSNLPHAVDHMVMRGLDAKKFHWIPNGFSMNDLNDKETLPAQIREKIPKNKFVVGYTGTIGVANALNVLAEAASSMKNIDDVCFVLVGDGKEKANIMDISDNLIFIDPIPKNQIQSMLSLFDVCYIGCNNDPMYRFGISPNKIPEYMLSSKPILLSCTTKGNSITASNSGIAVDSGVPDLVQEAILKLKDMPKKEREALGSNGRNFAIENFDYSELTKKFSNILF